MENAISVNVSPIQVIIALAFQIWIIVFPIIIIRKINYLTSLVVHPDEEEIIPDDHEG